MHAADANANCMAAHVRASRSTDSGPATVQVLIKYTGRQEHACMYGECDSMHVTV